MATAVAISFAADGSFTQEDPIGIAGGLNLYGYAGSDPVNYADPLGLCRGWLWGDDGANCDYDNNGVDSPDEIAAYKVAHSKSAFGRAFWNVVGVLSTALTGPRVQAGIQLIAAVEGGGEAEGELPELSRIHPDATYQTDEKAASSLKYWRGKSTQDIVESLRPTSGNNESLKTLPDGRIMNGNTRTRVLEERGYPINTLPREVIKP